jgi:hypothetical protein
MTGKMKKKACNYSRLGCPNCDEHVCTECWEAGYDMHNYTMLTVWPVMQFIFFINKITSHMKWTNVLMIMHAWNFNAQRGELQKARGACNVRNGEIREIFVAS